LSEGVDFWYTAFIYGHKRSEQIIGEVLQKEKKRQDIVLATKGSHRFEGNEAVMDNHPDFLKQAVRDSLHRLQTDYLDLYYIHFLDEDTPKYEADGALQELKEKVDIRYVGVSNLSQEELKEST